MDAAAYTVVAASDGIDSHIATSSQELRTLLQKPDDELKLEALRTLITSTLNGHPHPTLLMPIIQYVLPSKSKAIKKMLHFYWEVCPKLDENGKLKQEMILVCNAIRNDLQHPNEYIRGSTLRFLQKIKEAELLEPLVPSILTCLEHRHSYVRKNALFCVYSVFTTPTTAALIPDAPDLMETFLAAEADSTCKRNAFIFLAHVAPEKAMVYLSGMAEQIGGADEGMQLAVIELIRKETKTGGGQGKARFVRVISELLDAPSHAVKYEAATTLATLTQSSAAIKATASALIELVVKESDNNVKLIVLDRLDALRKRHEHVIDPLVMDVLRVLSSTDMDVKRKALNIALEMVTSRNIEEVVLFLKKELMKTVGDGTPGVAVDKAATEYKQLLIQSIHACAIKFGEVASNVVHVLMEFLGDSSNSSAVDVISFVREVVEKFPDLRSSILEKLLRTFDQIKSGKVFRGALWIVGEYCESVQDVKEAMQQVRNVIGELPILAAEERALEATAAGEDEQLNGGDSTAPAAPKSSGPKVRADGTYATETAFEQVAKLDPTSSSSKPPLRSLLLLGDFYTATVLASTLVKLVMHFSAVSSDTLAVNSIRAESMLIMTSIIRVGQSSFSAAPIDEDSVERIMTCIQTLATFPAGNAGAEMQQDEDVADVFFGDTKAAYAKMIAHQEAKKAEELAKQTKIVKVQADDLLTFRQFSKKNAAEAEAEDLEKELVQATGVADSGKDDFISKLQRVIQLTGFSDPVYAEAYVHVHQFDILLDVLVVNQTAETLQNLNIEFATLGDLKLVERPSSYTLAPYNYQSIKAAIKVSSTETGVIFGNIIYEGSAPASKSQKAGSRSAVSSSGASAGESNCVVLNDIHIDIMDYIKPARCTETQFRSMWTEFEWENKVNVNTTIPTLRKYLEHMMKSTNMACLTPTASLAGECGFLSANLYARSLFGEDALANLSIEQLKDGTIQGHVRIRSKTQGIALSLGDKITLAQKGPQADD
ncbi:putative SEC26-coatomer complex beta chain of secretory pathway vesicles [Tilletiaria anomala UBC 951]|uniref:Coatomer subunit beta n=1 Tax=Tilletiaria anomala (strain ATCC 24038 / CBS 436.72 / UBC 951) TaxID=1037660 RepID=A0A066VH23_TILAU|nr:putative SEC26-coatomer complex beta chain of secretory pathway vesicles [Tilletiaria anomala UBC 951]KDN39613.1 putative SEC26-coatomer complex beta chain of secretory pathway vesicles [Tilletiaria anomala UBC 951]